LWSDNFLWLDNFHLKGSNREAEFVGRVEWAAGFASAGCLKPEIGKPGEVIFCGWITFYI